MSNQLLGVIRNDNRLHGTLTDKRVFRGTLSVDRIEAPVYRGALLWDTELNLLGVLQPDTTLRGFFSVSNAYETYAGPYRVTPKASTNQVLQTSSCLMNEDVTILEVPYYEVGNASDGTTVYIAEEVTNNGN